MSKLVAAAALRWHWAFVCCIALGFMVAAGCPQFPPDDDGTPATRMYSGRVNDTQALVALIIHDSEVIAYVCDGIEGDATISGWFEGLVQDGMIDLPLVSGTSYEGTGAGRRLTGNVQNGAIEGEYILEDGTTRSYRAELNPENTPGGLYVSADDESTTGVVVTNEGEAQGLSRSADTGWTARVTLPDALPTKLTSGGTLNVEVLSKLLQVNIIRTIPDLRIIIRNELDPLPTVGNGTLMVHVLVENDRAVGYRYATPRPDAIGLPTLELTRQLRGTNRPPKALRAFMRVRVLDESGGVLSGQYIRDPLSRFVEVPAGEKGEELFWTQTDREPASILLAVPNIKGARRIALTRFNDFDQPIDAGEVDLSAKPTPRKQRTAQSTDYDPANAEHATVIDNGSSQDRFDLLILAEGFRDTNADRLAFNQAVQDLLNYMWTIPIYAEFQASINVHTAYLPSVDSGANHPQEDPPVEVDTPYGAFFNCNSIERLLCLSNAGQQLAYDVAELAAGNLGEGSIDSILVLVNDSKYGGAGGAILTSSINVQSPEIATHEFGHSAIGLADEYETEYEALVEAARLKPNVSGEIGQPSELKWFDLVTPGTAIPTALDNDGCTRNFGCTPFNQASTLVGMYEGAGYVACGSFRPTTACHMRCYVNDFCPVCARAFRNVLEPFTPPTVDMYMRDNRLDVGNVPSPANVEDPPGSGQRVKPYHSVDIRVDAPPFGEFGTEAPHENPIAGVANRVFVTVHNRGTEPAGEFASVTLHAASATGGAPPFPGANWANLGAVGAVVPGLNGSFTMMLVWNVPADAAEHTCLIATVASASDPLPPLNDPSLTNLVRTHNNITWKNLHVVTVPEIQGEISNFADELQPIVFRIEAPDVPVGTGFDLSHDDTLSMTEFEPGDVRQMDLLEAQAQSFRFVRSQAGQEWFSLRTDLPGSLERVPFRANFVLKVQLPGGTPVGERYTISIDQIAVDPQTGILGDIIGGNTYSVSFD